MDLCIRPPSSYCGRRHRRHGPCPADHRAPHQSCSGPVPGGTPHPPQPPPAAAPALHPQHLPLAPYLLFLLPPLPQPLRRAYPFWRSCLLQGLVERLQRRRLLEALEPARPLLAGTTPLHALHALGDPQACLWCLRFPLLRNLSRDGPLSAPPPRQLLVFLGNDGPDSPGPRHEEARSKILWVITGQRNLLAHLLRAGAAYGDDDVRPGLRHLQEHGSNEWIDGNDCEYRRAVTKEPCRGRLRER
mmetsp:Transcript_41028/g.96315  ORF Transcript_41028/g.96315 Transcript_41028/m.96315 type:complete len:245 (-) Transcript_41028:415-1149(-)